jgi:hypothetical protein
MQIIADKHGIIGPSINVRGKTMGTYEGSQDRKWNRSHGGETQPASSGEESRAEAGSTGAGRWEAVLPNPKLKLMDHLREVMRVKHYAIRTEQCCCDWIRRDGVFMQVPSLGLPFTNLANRRPAYLPRPWDG